VASIPNNIIIGEPLVSLDALGIEENETVVRFTFDDLRNEQGNVFLPQVLKEVGVFQSTGQARTINEQRMKSSKFKDDPDQNIWRNIDRPEFTNFKIGKKVFWLIVGE